MEIPELILVGLGSLVSLIAFFLKKESVRVGEMSEKIAKLEISLAKNGARDAERWEQTVKLLEDRREDVMRLYEKINKLD